MSETESKEKGIEAGKSEAAEASSAHSRINVPLNLDNWKDLPEDAQEELLWFHQHLLDNRLDWDAAAEATGYDRSTIFRWLKGTYEGSWGNAVKAIKGYRRIAEQRGSIRANVIVRNHIAQMVGAGLDYALANNSITTIIGESRMGKTVSALLWRDANNHGTSVYVVAPPYGGTKLFLRRIAETVGANKNLAVTHLYETIARGFNRNRMLIIDEAHRLLPNDRRSNPVGLEILRDLHDTTHCALALISTQRFDDDLRRGAYQYEQVLGRIGMPIRLPRTIVKDSWLPIVQQYVPRPSAKLQAVCDQIANDLGRLGILVETLKVASRLANKAKVDIAEEHVFRAVALRRQMMGETQYAGK
jgi:DNA transposition AAA+ family ATPase